jgi:hypothetical protein
MKRKNPHFQTSTSSSYIPYQGKLYMLRREFLCTESRSFTNIYY